MTDAARYLGRLKDALLPEPKESCRYCNPGGVNTHIAPCPDCKAEVPLYE